MSDQYFRDRYNTSSSIENTGQEANSPVVNSNPFAEQVTTVDSVLVQEMPLGGAVAAIGSMDGTTLNGTSIYETPTQEIPVVEPATVVDPQTKTIPYPAQAGVIITNDYQVSKDVFYVAPVTETVSPAAPAVTSAVPAAALLTHEESEHFRTRWNEIQGKFVDEPRSAVQEADKLVSEVIVQITQMFAKEHSALDSQWNQGSDVSTEDLRKALQHYRAFFNRLLK